LQKCRDFITPPAKTAPSPENEWTSPPMKWSTRRAIFIDGGARGGDLVQ